MHSPFSAFPKRPVATGRAIPSHPRTAGGEVLAQPSSPSAVPPSEWEEQDRETAARFFENLNRVYTRGIEAAVRAQACVGCGHAPHDGSCPAEPRYVWSDAVCGCTE